MAVYFSSASQDENGSYSGGKAGDQTGKEVRTTKAYTHKLGWRIFRHPNDTTAYWIGTNAKAMADNNNFGYDQGQRLTGYTASKNAGWEPSNVTTPCELDCSSFVRTAVACALEKDIANFNTSNEASVLFDLGFKEITGTSLDNLKKGDILVTKSKGHTEIVSQGASDTTQTITSTTSNAKANVYYQVIADGKNYAEVKNCEDYAGDENKAFQKLAMKVDKGTISYQVHTKGGTWLPYVTGYNWWDNNNGYAGTASGATIDGIRIKTTGCGGSIKYRVSYVGSNGWLPWVKEATDFAGVLGKAIDKLEAYIE